jgi:hypothetical protein
MKPIWIDDADLAAPADAVKSWVFHGSENFASSDEHKALMRNWHMNRSTEWLENLSTAAKESYTPELREIRSTQMKDRWANDDGTLREAARRNARDNKCFGKDNPKTKAIEYNGTIYYGWRELYEATGISKYKYLKWQKSH